VKTPVFVTLVVFSVVAVDQATKHLVMAFLPLHESREVLPFLHIVHFRNTGAAFGMFRGMGSTYFVLLSLVAIVFIVYLLKKKAYNAFGLSLVLGGALGNLIDRVLYGNVVDFIDFFIGSFHWPAFNVADSSLTVGIAIIVIRHLLGKK